MPPIPDHEKMVRVKQSTNVDGDVGDAPCHKCAENTSDRRPGSGDERALPQKNRADVDSPIAHRPQNCDLFYLREHRHGQDVENPETGEQNNQQHVKMSTAPHRSKNLQVRFFAFLPAESDVLENVLELSRESGRTLRIA